MNERFLIKTFFLDYFQWIVNCLQQKCLWIFYNEIQSLENENDREK